MCLFRQHFQLSATLEKYPHNNTVLFLSLPTDGQIFRMMKFIYQISQHNVLTEFYLVETNKQTNKKG